MSSLKLLWLPGPTLYKLRVFAGPNTQRRVFAGELALAPDAARVLHGVIEQGNLELGEPLSGAGWIDPVVEGAA